MSICSAHRTRVADCELCNTNILDVIPNFTELLAQAEAMGRRECKFCGFTFYKTVDFCPRCDHEINSDL